jgi:hypothetical protein
MRRALVVVLVVALAGCSSPEPVAQAPGAAPTTPTPPAYPVTRVPLDLQSQAVRAVPGIPRSLPSVDAPLPSVLDDPPGRARLAYHPPEWWGDAVGWASETILLLGADGRWRRLALADLDRPESEWPGADTYGAGELSPDGRWWAGKSRAGVLLLDLRTGQHRLVALDTDWVAQVRWLPDSSGFLAAYGLGNRPGLKAAQVTLPGLRVRPVPYDVWEVGFQPDGTPLTLPRARDGSYDVVAWPKTREVVRGTVRFPLAGRRNRTLAPVPTTGRYAVLTQHRSTRPVDLVVLDSETHEIEHVLRFDQRRVKLWYVWWLDSDRLILQTRRDLVVWDLRSGSVRRVAAGPEPNGESWWAWTVDIAEGS